MLGVRRVDQQVGEGDVGFRDNALGRLRQHVGRDDERIARHEAQALTGVEHQRSGTQLRFLVRGQGGTGGATGGDRLDGDGGCCSGGLQRRHDPGTLPGGSLRGPFVPPRRNGVEERRAAGASGGPVDFRSAER